jgi:SAM-dependent methyltransferase
MRNREQPPADRIAAARARLPAIDFRCVDASALPFEPGFFDVALESTMFVQIVDDDLAGRIAAEMLRVTRRGGHIVLVDWRFARPRSGQRALSMRRIERLFDVGTASELDGRFRGALLPPLGRYLSAHVPSLYFAVRAMLPLATAQFATVLRRL